MRIPSPSSALLGAEIRDSRVLKRELLVAPLILLPAFPQDLKPFPYSANEDFCLVQTQGSFGGCSSR